MNPMFASDNSAGVHPKIRDAMREADSGYILAYGHETDGYTQRAVAKFRDHCGPDAGVYFVFGGTGANVAGLSAALQDSHLVVCSDGAHIYCSESGAPHAFTGCRFLPIESPDGKLTPQLVDESLDRSEKHGVISISQPTEYGTVYSHVELSDISEYAHRAGFRLHVDGARICNAAAHLGTGLYEAARGADVISFGGTKNGMQYGEAVLILNPELNKDFSETRIRSTQRPSKMRYIAAQFDALLTDDLWRLNASHANRMAYILYHAINDVPNVNVTQPVQSNAVFAKIPKESIKPLQERYFFWPWDEDVGEVRWMTSWSTTEDDVYDFARYIREIVK